MRKPVFKDDPQSLDEAVLIELIEYAYAKGITYFDTAENYIEYSSENLIGQVIKSFHEKITLATKVGIWHIKESIADVEDLIMSQLKRLNTEYIDFYMIHALTDARWKTFGKIGIIKLFERVKNDGIIRHYGFSYHGTEFFLKKLLLHIIGNSHSCR